MKMMIDCPDERLTPKFLERCVKEAKQLVSIKLMVGSLDKKEDASLIVVIGLLDKCKFSPVEA